MHSKCPEVRVGNNNILLTLAKTSWGEAAYFCKSLYAPLGLGYGTPTLSYFKIPSSFKDCCAAGHLENFPPVRIIKELGIKLIGARYAHDSRSPACTSGRQVIWYGKSYQRSNIIKRYSCFGMLIQCSIGFLLPRSDNQDFENNRHTFRLFAPGVYIQLEWLVYWIFDT